MTLMTQTPNRQPDRWMDGWTNGRLDGEVVKVSEGYIYTIYTPRSLCSSRELCRSPV